MGIQGERLYHRLPAIYRIRDAEVGQPLRALLAVAERELEAIEEDIDELYENWFIETCADWVVPYIGDLLGVKPVHTVGAAAGANLRSYVAHTLAYRRRKGTAFVLEQLAHDLTGWPARVAEFYQRLNVTQHVNHVRGDCSRQTEIRDPEPLELLRGPFEQAGHAGEPVRPGGRKARYNLANVGLFLWRLGVYPVERGDARPVDLPSGGTGYTFMPFMSASGRDIPLFNPPQTETELSHLAGETNSPGKLRRHALAKELEARRQALVDRRASETGYFGPQPVLAVYLDSSTEPVAPEAITVCDLRDWRVPASEQVYLPSKDPHGVKVGGTRFPIIAAIDPERGRLILSEEHHPRRVQVSYTYGFSGDVGGGPYDRQDDTERDLELFGRPLTWQIGISKEPDADEPERVVESFSEAIQLWNDHVASGTVRPCGLITVMDSATYSESLVAESTLELPAGGALAIVAATWPGAGRSARRMGRFAADEVRPHLHGNLSVRGFAARIARTGSARDTEAGQPAGDEPGELILNGLLIEGRVNVLTGDLGRLRLNHCTLVPGLGGLSVRSSSVSDKPALHNASLQVEIHRSICDSITFERRIPGLTISDSIIGAIDAPDAETGIHSGTVFGNCRVRSIAAENSIFAASLWAERTQVGCLRFCYQDPVQTDEAGRKPRTPRRYRCQPDPSRAGRAERARLRPRFRSTIYGDPEYAQLSPACAEEIRTGAENGSEMGVFQHLCQPQREANLRVALDEYLRLGLKADIIFVT